MQTHSVHAGSIVQMLEALQGGSGSIILPVSQGPFRKHDGGAVIGGGSVNKGGAVLHADIVCCKTYQRSIAFFDDIYTIFTDAAYTVMHLHTVPTRLGKNGMQTIAVPLWTILHESFPFLADMSM